MRTSLLGGVLLAVAITNPSQITFKANGGTSRSLAVKLGDVVSVKDFGAVGDGVTDDTAAVAAAYAATATSGAAIYFPAGTYKFNLTILRSGVSILGSGRARVADSVPVGGSMFTPADLTKPIIQIGDGTTLVEKTTVEHFSMKGDGTFTTQGTSTSDGVVVFGAYNTRIADFEIGYMGGKSAYVTAGATRASAYTHFVNGEFINFSRYGLLVDNGSKFSAGTSLSQVNFSPAQQAGGDYDLRVEGTDVSLSNCWVQVLDGHAHVYLLKDGGGALPKLQINNTSIDTGGSTAFTAMDINIGGAHRLLNWYVSGVGYIIDGKIRWDDATVVDGATSIATVPPAYRYGLAAKVQQNLYFDIAWNGSSEYNDVNAPAMSLRGGERTTGGAVPYLEFIGGHYRVPGLFNQALQLGSASALWKNATTKRLHWRNDFAYPGNDIDGAPISALQKVVTYSASMTPSSDQGSWFWIAATNGTAFTINAPTINATVPANLSGYRITVTVSNQSGGALGVATWNAAYKMGAAWTQPANGFNRSIDFLYDGTNWYEVSRSAADVTN